MVSRLTIATAYIALGVAAAGAITSFWFVTDVRNQQAQEARNAALMRQQVLQARRASVSLLGRRLRWVPLQQVNEENIGRHELGREGPLLLLLLDELSCSLCQDPEATFAKIIAAQHRTNNDVAVAAIVKANTLRSAAAYARVNEIPFPVFFDDGTFLKANEMRGAPMVVLLNQELTVVAADSPIEAIPELMDPIHDAAFRLLVRADLVR